MGHRAPTVVSLGWLLALALAGCGGLPLPGASRVAPTIIVTLTVTPAPPTATVTPSATPVPPTAIVTATESATASTTPGVTPSATLTPSPLPSPTETTPTATAGPTEEPLYLAPTPIPGAPTAAPPTDTPTPSATPTLTAAASPTPDSNASPTPTATYPPVPVISSLRGTVANTGNVRADPNVRASSLDRVNTGEEVQLLGRSDNGRWYLVLTVRGVAGWVSATLLSVTPETAAQVPLNPDIVLPTPPGGAP